jgi:hypothetical protein
MIHPTCFDHTGSSSGRKNRCIPVSLVRHTLHTICHCYKIYIKISFKFIYSCKRCWPFGVNFYRFTYSFCGVLIKCINKLAIINSVKRWKSQRTASAFMVCIFSYYIQINLYLNFRQLLSLNIIHPHSTRRLRKRGSKVDSCAIISVYTDMEHEPRTLNSRIRLAKCTQD